MCARVRTPSIPPMFEFTVPTPSAIETLQHLSGLRAERALAVAGGREHDVAELDDEIAATTVAFVGTTVTEIATLRAELDAPLQG
jgi:hypothetical protein